MPRKRMIDPNFWRDEKIGKCTYIERLLFQGLWTFAEDNGVGRASPLLIKADIFPYDPLREADIRSSLEKLSGLGLILLYEIDGQSYYFIKNFKKHQTINKPSQCTLPEPLPEHYRSTTVVVTSQDKIKEDKLKEKNIYTEIIDYLNVKVGTSYRAGSQKTKDLIRARMNEGFTLADFTTVIDKKTAEWNHTPRQGEKDMRGYLRPETLFGTKFESYLNQQGTGEAGKKPSAATAGSSLDKQELHDLIHRGFADDL